MLTIKVQYSCHECGLYKAECEVPARADKDLERWLEVLGQHLLANHMLRSPNCGAESLADVMIPMAHGSDRVGGPEQN